MSRWLERLLGTENLEEYADYDEDSYFDRKKEKDNELKEKIFNPEEDLTYEKFARLIDITLINFRKSFGCFGSDYEVVFRKKSNQLVKKKVGKIKMINNDEIKFCIKDEIEEWMDLKERLMFVDDGVDEVIGKFVDLPDIIVDFCRKLGSRDFKIYNFIMPTDKPIITTKGMFLDKCPAEDRQALIGRLIKLQQYDEELDLLYKKGLIDIDELDDMQRQKRNTQGR